MAITEQFIAMTILVLYANIYILTQYKSAGSMQPYIENIRQCQFCPTIYRLINIYYSAGSMQTYTGYETMYASDGSMQLYIESVNDTAGSTQPYTGTVYFRVDSKFFTDYTQVQ